MRWADLTGALVVAALAELLLLRTLLRMGPFLPQSEGLAGLYAAVRLGGVASMNLAMLLGLAVVAGRARAAIAQPGRAGGLLAGLATALALLDAGLALGLGPLLGPGTLLVGSLLLPATLGAALAAGCPGRQRRLAAALLAPYAAAAYHYAAQPAASLGVRLPLALPAFFAAEALAVGVALALPALAQPRHRRGAALVGGLAGGLFLAAHLLRPWTVATIAMWDFAFTLFLPPAIYAAALALATWSVVALWGEGDAGQQRASGLLLIFLGGLKLDYTYLALLGLVGLLLVTCPAPPSRPGPRSL